MLVWQRRVSGNSLCQPTFAVHVSPIFTVGSFCSLSRVVVFVRGLTMETPVQQFCGALCKCCMWPIDPRRKAHVVEEVQPAFSPENEISVGLGNRRCSNYSIPLTQYNSSYRSILNYWLGFACSCLIMSTVTTAQPIQSNETTSSHDRTLHSYNCFVTHECRCD